MAETVSLSGRGMGDLSEGSALGKALYISGHGENRRQPPRGCIRSVALYARLDRRS